MTQTTTGTQNFIRGQYLEVLNVPPFTFHPDMQYDGLILAACTKWQTADGYMRSQRGYLFIELDENGIVIDAVLRSTDYGCPELCRWSADKITVS